MIRSLRKSFNDTFTNEKYRQFLADLELQYPHSLDFRIAETPVFVDSNLARLMEDTSEYIIDEICREDFQVKTNRAIPANEFTDGPEGRCHFIAFDFGICKGEDGNLKPMLIELQGFPTLFAFQAHYPEILERHFHIPAGYSHYFNGLDTESYISLLKKILLGNHHPEEVILLELRPDTQKTRIDFYCTGKYTGIEPVCITSLIREGNNIFYVKDGQKVRVKRIYNRVIADELKQAEELPQQMADLKKGADVEWVPHPNWFYRISKFTMPLLKHANIPETKFLHSLDAIPDDLEEYVLKPLFSFAGQGVVIDVNKSDIESINDPENWIIQRKVQYADCIETPDGNAKVEIRLIYFWEDGKPRPILVNNLARISKGKMIGTRYNKDKTWVGGSVAYFEQ